MTRLRDHGVEIDWTEYAHFVEFGRGDQWVADRLGVHVSSLRTALGRREKARRDAEKGEAA